MRSSGRIRSSPGARCRRDPWRPWLRTILGIAAALLLHACGASPDVGVAAVHQEPTFIIDPPTNQNIDVGDTLTYSGRVASLFSVAPGGSTAAASRSAAVVTWISSDTMVATINPAGLLHAIRSGSVTITGMDPSGLQSSVVLHVVPPIAAVRITSDKRLPLASGDTATLTFAAIDSAGAVVPGVPIFWFQSGFGITLLSAPPAYKEFTSPATMRLTFDRCCDATIYLGSANVRPSRQHSTSAHIGG